MRNTLARPFLSFIVGLLLVMVLSLSIAGSVDAHPEGPGHHNPLPSHATEVMRALWNDRQGPENLQALATTTCSGGFAGSYPCSNVDLLAFMPLADIGGTRSNSAANDIWGWTDPAGNEYAIIGRVFGTSFVDISDPTNPVYLGDLPTHGAFGSSWRDIKVYADHAFIVSEANQHGMQVFDLNQLSGVTNPPVTFDETAHYNKNASAHNIVINEDSGYAFIVGASGKNSCSGGLHMVDISTPTNPQFAGCFSADGYTHDAQCVIYNGPDADHQGKEICINANEDTVTIVDVTNKSNPVQLSRTGYAGSSYTHQGWLTEDHTYYLLDDELDEQNFGHGTRTRIWDVSDLDAPSLISFYDSAVSAIDHNQYVKGNFVYQANYRAGLRILDASDAANGNLTEVAFFDIYPANDSAQFNAAWSNFPYFDSGVVVVSGIEQGLFILQPNLGPVDSPPSVTISSPADGATFSSGESIAFAGSASDSEDGEITADLAWTSDQDGQIGTGGSFSATLSDGPHIITASVTDSGGNTRNESVSIVVGDIASITLSVNAYKVRGDKYADLTWSGATSANVDIFRDGGLIATTPDDGATTDGPLGKGGGSSTYQVCEEGTTVCSDPVVANW